MSLTRLHVERVRNIDKAVLLNLQSFNVFFGKNASGKTSILEAIHLLSTGRSFRTYIPKNYVQHQQNNAIIFGEFLSDKVGIQKFSSGEQIIKVNGDLVATQGQLAKLLPLQYLDPLSTDIIDHGAKDRRQLLDWLMFHVEPDFYTTWQLYSRALKQRNILLKASQKVTSVQLEPWDNMLAEFGELLHLQRIDVFEQWRCFFKQELAFLLPDLDVEMLYQAGFHVQNTLLSDLKQHQKKDLERRQTQYGPHRADIVLKTTMGYANTVLSRGQKKLLIVALKLSQIAMLHASNKETVVLLDDLTAELDTTAQARLIQRLSQLKSQVFLTTLDRHSAEQHLKNLSISYQLFHIDSGQVQALEV